MSWDKQFREELFHIDESTFNEWAVALFRQQVQDNPVYRQFVDLLNVEPANVQNIEDIPFLPVELFKSKNIYLQSLAQPEAIFYSSGTSGQQQSRHLVRDISLYEESCLATFRMFYGDPSNYCIVALLPSYFEQSHSSLVYMTDLLIHRSQHPLSGFYLHDYRNLWKTLNELRSRQEPIFLLGVSFALWELAEQYPMDLSGSIIMETGGMKGKRKELVRQELHNILKDAFNVEAIHSEYGMTELLSQAYATGEGRFRSPPRMKILIRDPYDPFSINPIGQTGGINIIDLANIYSCSFIQTSDLGKIHADGSFEVLGRFDESDVRGCNIMI
ncbi:MAG: acyl transferase [Bacteroidetes bacterium SW_11_45_7]|nr:MAG: acyl transferase [Bacteroidetes bacterium SW_11_45_7]